MRDDTTADSPGGLAAWGEKLTCYTAALAGWLAAEGQTWWRPLLAGGPVLRIEPAGDGLHKFAHHWRAPAPSLGLALSVAQSWAEAGPALDDLLTRHGRVVIAGDGFRLPWQRAWRRRHVPHWFLLRRTDDGRLRVDDPLTLVNELGRQDSASVVLRREQLPEACRALPPGSVVFSLREAAALGLDDPVIGPSYRWLSPVRVGDSRRLPPQSAELARSDPTVTALHDLAAAFAAEGTMPSAYRQVDDLWQALRQRELATAALAVERVRRPCPADMPDPRGWTDAVAAWRRLLVLLFHARLAAESGQLGGRAAAVVARAFEQLAGIEDRLASERLPLGLAADE
jgi:hypothetical protein